MGHGRGLIAGAAALLAVAVATPARAQRVAGRVTMEDSLTPAVGVTIEARRAGEPFGHRTRTNARGAYELILSDAEPHEYSVLRVGHRPVRLGVMTVAAGELRRRDVVLQPQPVALVSQTVATPRACGSAAVDGGVVGTLIDQARAVIASSATRRDDQVIESRWSTFRIVTDRRSTPFTEVMLSEHTGSATSPFMSVGAERLEREGYVIERDTEYEYRAPDADVLLSETFVLANCFQLVADSAARPGQVGVRFTPIVQGSAEHVRVHGTLWFRREDAALSRLEFGYDGLHRDIETVGAGGTIDFVQLAPGTWSVLQWDLRMPRMLGYGAGVRGASRFPTVTRGGGQLDEVRIDSTVVYRAAERVPSLLDDVAQRTGMSPSCDIPGLPSDPRAGGVVSGIATTPDGRLLRNGYVTARWAVGARRTSTVYRQFVSDGFFLFCDVPYDAMLQVFAEQNDLTSEVYRVRVSRAHSLHRLTLGIREKAVP